MKKSLQFILALFCALVFVLVPAIEKANAQTVQPFIFETFASDTAVNADTVIFTVSKTLPAFYKYAWFVDFTTNSGTRAGTLVIQEEGGSAGNSWVTVATKAFVAGTADTLLTGSVYGQRQRARFITTGTQNTTFTVKAAYKKEN